MKPEQPGTTKQGYCSNPSPHLNNKDDDRWNDGQLKRASEPKRNGILKVFGHRGATEAKTEKLPIFCRKLGRGGRGGRARRWMPEIEKAAEDLKKPK